MSIVFEQALHGYQEGHRLLGITTKLHHDSLQQMLVLSDNSGVSADDGFSSYLTGYPLLSDNYYVLARTWYASEMKRPGCVWTHSLLIKKDDIDLLNSVESLLSLFSRPKNNEANVLQPIKCLPFMGKDNVPNRLKFKNLLLGLYGTSHNSHLLIPAIDSSQYEFIILYAWLQMEKEGKKKFSFSSGSLGDRKQNETYFDLQVVPYRKIRSSSLREEKALVLELNEAKKVYPRWADILTNLIETNKKSELDSFARLVSADSEIPRRDYPVLVNVFNLLGLYDKGAVDISLTYKSLHSVKNYPFYERVVSYFQEQLLSPDSSLFIKKNFFSRIDEVIHSNFFDSTRWLDQLDWIDLLWNNARMKIIESAAEGNDLRKELLDRVVRACSFDEFFYILKKNKQLAKVIYKNREFEAFPEFWEKFVTCSGEEHDLIFSFYSSEEIDVDGALDFFVNVSPQVCERYYCLLTNRGFVDFAFKLNKKNKFIFSDYIFLKERIVSLQKKFESLLKKDEKIDECSDQLLALFLYSLGDDEKHYFKIKNTLLTRIQHLSLLDIRNQYLLLYFFITKKVFSPNLLFKSFCRVHHDVAEGNELIFQNAYDKVLIKVSKGAEWDCCARLRSNFLELLDRERINIRDYIDFIGTDSSSELLLMDFNARQKIKEEKRKSFFENFIID